MTESERRSAILQAAARLFEHYGYAKTTMADVAREAQIGVGTVYLEFDSKEAIVQELSSSTHAGVLKAMRVAADKGSDDAKRLSAVLMARTDCFLELRSKGQHACDLLHHPNAQRPLKGKAEGIRVAKSSFHQAELALFEELIKRGQSSGAFASGNAARAAASIQRAFASLTPPWLFADDACASGEATNNDAASDARRKRASAAELCQLLLDGLRSRSDVKRR